MANPGSRSIAALILIALSLGGCGALSVDPGARLSERECLARVMYFESNRSSEDGMLAVGTVVMNRVDDPRYPKSVCGVVGQSNQFAEGALTKPVNPRLMARTEKVADAVLAGERHPSVGEAKFFHTVGYTYPYRNMHYVTLAGGNAFYEKRPAGTFTNHIDPAPGLRRVPSEPAVVLLAAARLPARPRAAMVAAAPLPVSPRPVVLASVAPPAKPKPIVLAMLADQRSRPSRSPRSIGELIDMDIRQR